MTALAAPLPETVRESGALEMKRNTEDVPAMLRSAEGTEFIANSCHPFSISEKVVATLIKV